MLSLPLLLLFLLLPLSNAQCPNLLPRIIGGTTTSNPFTLSLLLHTPLGTRHCTAALITPTHALTAAHCAVNTSWTISTSSGRTATIQSVSTHPSYISEQTSRPFDIAVIKLSPLQSPLLLPMNPLYPLPDSYIRVFGYGGSTTLEQVDLPVVAFEHCQTAYSQVLNAGDLDAQRQMCAGYERGGCDSCVGDSGGPAVQFTKQGQVVLIGLVSFGYGCAEPGFPGVYVKVQPHREWIQSVVGDGIKNGVPLQVGIDTNGQKPMESVVPHASPLPQQSMQMLPSMSVSPAASAVAVQSPDPTPTEPTTPSPSPSATASAQEVESAKPMPSESMETPEESAEELLQSAEPSLEVEGFEGEEAAGVGGGNVVAAAVGGSIGGIVVISVVVAVLVRR